MEKEARMRKNSLIGLTACLVSALLVMLLTASPALSLSQLAIIITTDKTSYHYRQLVKTYGNVTFNGQLVDQGLVALQLQDSLDRLRALRIVPANATPAGGWAVEITSFIAQDSVGNPKTVFTKGSSAWFNVTVNNNDQFGSKSVLLTLTLCDVDSTPFQVHFLSLNLIAGGSFTEIVRIDIEGYDGTQNWVSTGTATAYATVCSDWPAAGGTPYSPEKAAVFTIVTSGGLASLSANPPPQTTLSSYKSFQANIRLPPLTLLGTYTVYGSAYHNGFTALSMHEFSRDYELKGDIIYNRKVDIFDVVTVSSAYGTVGGNSRWNPEADLVANGKVDIFDVVTVSSNYGVQY